MSNTTPVNPQTAVKSAPQTSEILPSDPPQSHTQSQLAQETQAGHPQAPQTESPQYGLRLLRDTKPIRVSDLSPDQCVLGSSVSSASGVVWFEVTTASEAGVLASWTNVSDQTPAALDSANTTDGSSRLSASVLFGPFVAVKALCEELLAEPGCPPWKVDALRTAVNAVNQIMMMSPGEIHLNSCNIREAISNQRGKCLCQIAFDSIPLSR